jgi:hypothetical protein
MNCKTADDGCQFRKHVWSLSHSIKQFLNFGLRRRHRSPTLIPVHDTPETRQKRQSLLTGTYLTSLFGPPNHLTLRFAVPAPPPHPGPFVVRVISAAQIVAQISISQGNAIRKLNVHTMFPPQILNMNVPNRVIPNAPDADDAQEKLEDPDFVTSQTGATQSTQQASQQPEMEGHLWGYLQPCSTKLTRIDFWKVRPSYKIGRMDDRERPVNDIVMPGMKISKLLIIPRC